MKKLFVPVLLCALSIVGTVTWIQAQQQKSGTADTAQTSKIPRTPDGRPDLQGIFSFSNMTPMERPAEFGNKAVLTPEEALAYQERAKASGNSSLLTVLAYDARIWRDNGEMTLRTSLIVDPPDGRFPPLTPEGKGRLDARAKTLYLGYPAKADGPEDRTLGERCIMGRPPGPPLRPETYNNTVQIFQTPKEVALLNEMGHMVRVIPTDGRPKATIRQYIGDSHGRWDGDTLVVETTNYRGDAAAFVGRFVATENLKVTERFKRIDADRLSYEFTMDDPQTWTRPWTAQFELRKETGMYETVCHEGNYGMTNMLSAARAEEKRGARGTK